MEALAIFGSLGDTALLLGLSTVRVAVAFLLVPLFSTEVIPSMVRNSMFLAIALLSLLIGQRFAKDYAGAAVVATYFAVALIGLSAF